MPRSTREFHTVSCAESYGPVASTIAGLFEASVSYAIAQKQGEPHSEFKGILVYRKQ